MAFSFLFFAFACGQDPASSLSVDTDGTRTNTENQVTICKETIDRAKKTEKILDVFRAFAGFAFGAIPGYSIGIEGVDAAIEGAKGAATDAITDKLFPAIDADCDPYQIQLDALFDLVEKVYSELSSSIKEMQDNDAKKSASDVSDALKTFYEQYVQTQMSPEFYYSGKDNLEYEKKCTKHKSLDGMTMLGKDTKCDYKIRSKIPKGKEVKFRVKGTLHHDTVNKMKALVHELESFEKYTFNPLTQPRDKISNASSYGIDFQFLTRALSMTIFPAITYGSNLAADFYTFTKKNDPARFDDTEEDVKGAYKSITSSLYRMLTRTHLIIKLGANFDGKTGAELYIMRDNDLPLIKLRDYADFYTPATGQVNSADDGAGPWRKWSEFQDPKEKSVIRYPKDQPDLLKNFEVMLDDDQVPYLVSLFGHEHGYWFIDTPENKKDDTNEDKDEDKDKKVDKCKYKACLKLKGRTFKFELPTKGAKSTSVTITAPGKTKGTKKDVWEFDVKYFKSDVFKDALRKAILKAVMDKKLDDDTHAEDARKMLAKAQEAFNGLKSPRKGAAKGSSSAIYELAQRLFNQGQKYGIVLSAYPPAPDDDDKNQTQTGADDRFKPKYKAPDE